MERLLAFVMAVVICVMYASGAVHMSETELEKDNTVLDAGTLREELLCGDFRHLRGNYGDYGEYFEAGLERGSTTWRQIDLNGDGVEDFILQEAEPVGDSGQKRIVGILPSKRTVSGVLMRISMTARNILSVERLENWCILRRTTEESWTANRMTAIILMKHGKKSLTTDWKYCGLTAGWTRIMQKSGAPGIPIWRRMDCTFSE